MSSQAQTISPRVVIQLLVFVILIPMLPLLISGRWDWLEAWIFAAVCIFGFAISRALAARRNPDLLAERARMLQHEDTKSWDKFLAPLVGLGGGLIPLVAGIEARVDWSPMFSPAVKIGALIVILVGWALGAYALVENRYFSGVVRIQTDRNHHVISSGPYRWMRHPGYAGALLTYLATPVFLDSPWAFLPVALIAVTLVVRTYLEDRTLCAELEGYSEYSQRVHHRLLPGVW